MSTKKDPPGYPGDEAIKKMLGEILRELRLKKGLSLEETDEFITQEGDPHPLFPRALAIVAKQLREDRRMSRAYLSNASGLPLALINRIEQGKAAEITITLIVRVLSASVSSIACRLPWVDAAREKVHSRNALDLRTAMKGRWEVNNKQWAVLQPILGPAKTAEATMSTDTRAVLNAVLWVLGTGAHWRELPSKYPPHETCHRRLQQWVKSGQLQRALCTLAKDLEQQGKLFVEEVHPDSSCSTEKKESRPRRIASTPLLPVFLSPLGLPLALTIPFTISSSRSKTRNNSSSPHRFLGWNLVF